MKNLYVFLLFLLATACTSPYRTLSEPSSHSLNLLPRQQPAKIYFPGYRMPAEAYYEMGMFEFELPVNKGVPENFLPKEIKKRNLDGAIVLDRRRDWRYRADGSSREIERLTCVGILFEKNAQNLSWLSHIDVKLYQDSVLFGQCQINFENNGQISGHSGSDYVFAVAKLVQPWYFLQQANNQWSERPSKNDWPHRRLTMGANFVYWLNKSEGDSLIYKISAGTYHSTKIYLEKIGNEMVPIKVVEDNQTGEVESLFLLNRLKQQEWHRTGHRQRLVYRYHYETIEDQEKFVLVQPQDLVQ